MKFSADRTPEAFHAVVGQTGQTGTYDFKLDFAPDLEQESSLPTLFTALREILGLELRRGKVSILDLGIGKEVCHACCEFLPSQASEHSTARLPRTQLWV